MRCVVENHMNDLIALADSVIAKPPTNIPTIDPNMMNPTNTQPSPPQQRTTCNGIRGYCIDTDAVYTFHGFFFLFKTLFILFLLGEMCR